MTEERVEKLVSVAFAYTAEIEAWRLSVAREEGERIERTLQNLLSLGHIAGFSIRNIDAGVIDDFVEKLRPHVGNMVLDACCEASNVRSGSDPTFLMPVWSFDHEIGGLPATTGHLLGLDLELIATPSFDEEFGAFLPGRDGRWLIHAGPMF